MKAKQLLNIVSTNWIHILGFYLTTYFSLILFKLIGLETSDGWESLLIASIFSILLLFLVYGLMIIGGFYLTIITMDIISFSGRNKWTKETLLIEWVIISVPFIYWAFKYEYWLWI